MVGGYCGARCIGRHSRGEQPPLVIGRSPSVEPVAAVGACPVLVCSCASPLPRRSLPRPAVQMERALRPPTGSSVPTAVQSPASRRSKSLSISTARMLGQRMLKKPRRWTSVCPMRMRRERARPRSRPPSSNRPRSWRTRESKMTWRSRKRPTFRIPGLRSPAATWPTPIRVTPTPRLPSPQKNPAVMSPCPIRVSPAWRLRSPQKNPAVMSPCPIRVSPAWRLRSPQKNPAVMSPCPIRVSPAWRLRSP